ncbi:MAG: thiamine phosphate synthase [Candidatus Methanomethylophilaceae archaeon]|jgi:thiamine-phosphate diphosphorylase
MKTPKIYVVTDRKIMSKPFAEKIADISASGADMVILREKDLSESEYKYLANECAAICTDYGVPLCINTFVDIAKDMGVDRVQIPLGVMRTLKDRDGLDSIGVSVHSLEEAEEAAELGADYLIAGPVYPTECKPDAEPKGPKFIEKLYRSFDIPVFGIGGINAYNIRHIASSGGSGACIRSSAMRTENLNILIRELKTNFEAGLEHL